jgi:hypothetical protein
VPANFRREVSIATAVSSRFLTGHLVRQFLISDVAGEHHEVVWHAVAEVRDIAVDVAMVFRKLWSFLPIATLH